MGKADVNSDRRGAALLLCVAFTAAAVSMVAVLSTRTVAHARQAESAALIAAAFSAAEVAQAQALADLRRGGTGALGFAGPLTWENTGRPILPRWGDATLDPNTDAGPPGVAWFSVAGRSPGIPEDFRVIYALARAGQIERCLEAVVRRDGGDWRLVTWRELAPEAGKDSMHAAL